MRSSKPILLKDALIFDGIGSAPDRGDLVFQHGKIVAWGPNIEAPADAVVIPMSGLCVSPGWIDLHTHVFAGQGVFSVETGEIGLQSGVTTLVDAGSAGALTFGSFVRHGIREARERILAYINVASGGLLHGHAAEPGFVGDHFHPRLHSIALAEAILEEYSDHIVGWKARLTAILADGCRAWERGALDALIELRDRTRRPVMVHHIESSIPPADLLARMQRRDVYTHLYHGRGGSLFHPESGEPLDAAWEGRQRGVIFDVGHGSGAFQWEVAERACQQFHFWPDTISTDLHRYNLFWPVRDLATTMSKFLHLGASLEAVIAMVTGNVQAALEESPDSPLAPSAPADLTLFEIEEGSFPLPDAEGIIRMPRKRILPLAVVRKGVVSPCYGFLARREISDSFATSLQSALCL